MNLDKILTELERSVVWLFFLCVGYEAWQDIQKGIFGMLILIFLILFTGIREPRFCGNTAQQEQDGTENDSKEE